MAVVMLADVLVPPLGGNLTARECWHVPACDTRGARGRQSDGPEVHVKCDLFTRANPRRSQ